MSIHPAQVGTGDGRFPEPGDVVRWYPDRGMPSYVTGIVMSGVIEGFSVSGHPISCIRLSCVMGLVPVANCRVIDEPIAHEAAVTDLVEEAVNEEAHV